MKRLPDGSYLYGDRIPPNRYLTQWAIYTIIVATFGIPPIFFLDPAWMVIVLIPIGQYAFECWNKNRKDNKIDLVEIPSERLKVIEQELCQFGFGSTRIVSQDIDDSPGLHFFAGHITLPKDLPENWSDATFGWVIRREVWSYRIFAKLFSSIVLGGLAASIFLYTVRPFGWEPFVYGLIIAVAMVAFLVPLTLRYENAGEQLASKGVPPSEALEYYRYRASKAITRLSNEEAAKEIARLQKRATAIGITTPIL